jgi:hypothetical protein
VLAFSNNLFQFIIENIPDFAEIGQCEQSGIKYGRLAVILQSSLVLIVSSIQLQKKRYHLNFFATSNH